jgi:hypothetical protein
MTTLDVQYRFDDEVKDDSHGTFTPEMLKIPQATWISPAKSPDYLYSEFG